MAQNNFDYSLELARDIKNAIDDYNGKAYYQYLSYHRRMSFTRKQTIYEKQVDSSYIEPSKKGYTVVAPSLVYVGGAHKRLQRKFLYKKLPIYKSGYTKYYTKQSDNISYADSQSRNVISQSSIIDVDASDDADVKQTGKTNDLDKIIISATKKWARDAGISIKIEKTVL